jgi:hypothetical protein
VLLQQLLLLPWLHLTVLPPHNVLLLLPWLHLTVLPSHDVLLLLLMPWLHLTLLPSVTQCAAAAGGAAVAPHTASIHTLLYTVLICRQCQPSAWRQPPHDPRWQHCRQAAGTCWFCCCCCCCFTVNLSAEQCQIR